MVKALREDEVAANASAFGRRRERRARARSNAPWYESASRNSVSGARISTDPEERSPSIRNTLEGGSLSDRRWAQFPNVANDCGAATHAAATLPSAETGAPVRTALLPHQHPN